MRMRTVSYHGSEVRVVVVVVDIVGCLGTFFDDEAEFTYTTSMQITCAGQFAHLHTKRLEIMDESFILREALQKA